MKRAVLVALALALTGCGGEAAVVIVIGGISVARLDIKLSRPTPQSIRVDWSDDHYVDTYSVRRDGNTLASSLTATTLIDGSVTPGVRYCYQVFGYDFARLLVAASEVACITA